MKKFALRKSKRNLERNKLSTSGMAKDCTYYEPTTVLEEESGNMPNPADNKRANASALTYWHDLRQAEALLHWQRWQNRAI